MKEAALFNLSTLRTETCFRTADGNFYGWEGCLDDEGNCYGNCTHVWGYEHCLVDLWSELAWPSRCWTTPLARSWRRMGICGSA